MSTPHSNALATLFGITPLMLSAVRTQIAPAGCPDEVLALYFTRCKNIGADPFGRQLYIQSRRSQLDGNWETRWMIETTIDGLRSIAETTGQYDGQEAPLYDYDKAGKLVSATVTIFRKDISHAITATAFFEEYVQRKIDGEIAFMWQKMPHNQLAKCAEALAYRKAFPRQLNGIYTDVEMEQANSLINVTPTDAANDNTANGSTATASNTPAPKTGGRKRDPNEPLTKPQETLIARRISGRRTEHLAELTEQEQSALRALIKELTATTREEPIDEVSKLRKREASTLLDRILALAPAA